MTLNSGTLIVGNSRATISAVANRYRTSPAVQAHYDLQLDGAQFAKILNQPTLPAGTIRTSGSLVFERKSNKALLDALQLDGDLTSSRLVLNAPTFHTEVRDVAAHYSLKNGDATLTYIRAELMGGELAGQGTMQAIGGDSHSEFQAQLTRISLPAIRKALGGDSKVKNTVLEGTGNATATATWGKTLNNLIVHSDVNLSGRVGQTNSRSVENTHQAGNGGVSSSTVPIDALLHATYRNDGQELRLVDSHLKSANTNLLLNGTISRNSSLALNLQANDLREANAWLAMFPSASGLPVTTDLAGTARFEGNVRDSVSVPHLTGELTAQNLHLNGTNWKILRTGVDVSPSRAALSNADLESAARGRVTANAAIELHNWSADRGSAVKLELNASQIDLATLARMSGQPQQVTGMLNAQLHANGTVENPTGNGSITLDHLNVYQQPVDSARLMLLGMAMRRRPGSLCNYHRET